MYWTNIWLSDDFVLLSNICTMVFWNEDADNRFINQFWAKESHHLVAKYMRKKLYDNSFYQIPNHNKNIVWIIFYIYVYMWKKIASRCFILIRDLIAKITIRAQPFDNKNLQIPRFFLSHVRFLSLVQKVLSLRQYNAI